MRKKRHEPCRGFECRYYQYDKYPNAPGGHTYCNRNPLMKIATKPLPCERCKVLNDCNSCIHAKTCQYSSAK